MRRSALSRVLRVFRNSIRCLFIVFIIIMLIPYRQAQSELTIISRMCHADQIKAFSSVTLFPKIAFILSHITILRAGQYSIPKNANLAQILFILWSGKLILQKFMVPDGISAVNLHKMLMQNQNLVGTCAVPPEGMIVATTYNYCSGITREQLVSFMLSESQKIRNKIAKSGNIWKDERSWITFASLLEKEGLDAQDKAMIAGTLLKRLRIKMALQVDATLLYIKTQGRYDARITMDEVIAKEFNNGERYQNPYNTYLHRGLPPGPICSPSVETLKIAAQANENDFLYYRLVNDRHIFSKTFTQHKMHRPLLRGR